MSKVSQEERNFFKETFTIKGRIFHPALLQPAADKTNPQKAPQYKVMACFLPQDNVQELQRLQQFLERAKSQFYDPQTQWSVNGGYGAVYPIKDFNTYRRQNGQPMDEMYRGMLWINAASGQTMQPPTFRSGMNGEPVQCTQFDAAEIYSGRNALIQISFYRISTNKSGFSANLNGVFLLDGGKAEGGFTFDPVAAFGNFLGGAMGPGQVQAPQQQHGHSPFGGQQAPQNPYANAPQNPYGGQPGGFGQQPSQPQGQPFQQPAAPPQQNNYQQPQQPVNNPYPAAPPVQNPPHNPGYGQNMGNGNYPAAPPVAPFPTNGQQTGGHPSQGYAPSAHPNSGQTTYPSDPQSPPQGNGQNLNQPFNPFQPR